jgi:hypothetical protein
LGYTLAWGSAYQVEGRLTSVWLASHFTPITPALPPDEELAQDHRRTATLAGAAQRFRTAAEDQPEMIALNAEIDSVTPRDLDRAIAARPGVRILVLNSPGGAVDSALVVAQEVKRRGLRTYVPKRMGCYSACAYIFFAGADRQVDGELGVHQISTEVNDLVLAQTTLGDVLDALYEFGVRQQVVSYMLRTPPEGMYVFSARELQELGINRGALRSGWMWRSTARWRRTPRSPVGAFVELARLGSREEAQQSLAYAEGRWSSLLAGERLTIDQACRWCLLSLRIVAGSLERANAGVRRHQNRWRRLLRYVGTSTR